MEWCDSCLSEKIGVSLDPLEALEMIYQVFQSVLGTFVSIHSKIQISVRIEQDYDCSLHLQVSRK